MISARVTVRFDCVTAKGPQGTLKRYVRAAQRSQYSRCSTPMIFVTAPFGSE